MKQLIVNTLFYLGDFTSKTWLYRKTWLGAKFYIWFMITSDRLQQKWGVR